VAIEFLREIGGALGGLQGHQGKHKDFRVVYSDLKLYDKVGSP
jgi:hypothetical protein